MKAVRKLARLGIRKWLVIGEAFAWFVIVEFCLCFLSPRIALKVVNRHCASESPTEDAISLVYCITLASRLAPFHMTCLKKALVTLAVIGPRHRNVQIVIGVSTASGQPDFHAWVEHNRRVIVGESVTEYLQFYRL